MGLQALHVFLYSDKYTADTFNCSETLKTDAVLPPSLTPICILIQKEVQIPSNQALGMRMGIFSYGYHDSTSLCVGQSEHRPQLDDEGPREETRRGGGQKTAHWII